MSENSINIVEIDGELKEIIPWYLDNRKKDIEQITQSLEKEDYETIHRLGHSMKGSGGGYGFDQITMLGKAIEQAAKEKNASDVIANIKMLENYLITIRIKYTD